MKKKFTLLAMMLVVSSAVMTDSGLAAKGAMSGKFSISSSKKVIFSPGNLQYQASTDTWRFAENQYDTIGSANMNASSTYDGWIDMFGWGASGYNDKYPYQTTDGS